MFSSSDCRQLTSTLCSLPRQRLRSSPPSALRASLWLASLPLLLSPWQPVRSAEGRSNGWDYFVGAGALYDDNLFRQPASVDLSTSGGLRRQDWIERASAGIHGSWDIARQNFELKAHGDENRFAHNDQLNNFSGNAAATWNWRVGGRWSGEVGADYARTLADFANNLLLEKDMLTQRGSFGSATYRLGPHWAVHGSVRWSSTTHSASERSVDDDNIRAQRFGVELILSPTDSLGWDYRHTNAGFTGDAASTIGSFNRDYDESSSIVWLKYALSGKTELDLQGGYLHRDYPDTSIANFSGDTWRAALKWRPGAKTQVALTGWRTLTAYIDAESDYFVETGASIAPTWQPTERVTASLAVSWQHQNYIGSNPALGSDALRRDTVKAAQANVTYTPRRALELDLTYRREERDSNRSLLTYRDDVAMLGVRVMF